MSDNHEEDLCALLDGELDDARARFLVRRLGHDRELAARWKRSHVVRAVMRRERRQDMGGFHQRIAAAIAVEPSPEGPHRGSSRTPTWLRPAIGFAVAASVATVAFNAFQQPMEPAPGSESARLAASLSAPVADQTNVPPEINIRQRATVASGGRTPGSEAWVNPRLQGYLLRHNETAGPRASRGLVPYVYLVSTPPDDDPADVASEDEKAQEPAGR